MSNHGVGVINAYTNATSSIGTVVETTILGTVDYITVDYITVASNQSFGLSLSSDGSSFPRVEGLGYSSGLLGSKFSCGGTSEAAAA